MTTKHETKGQRRIVISPEVIEQWLIHGSAIQTNLPNDARLIDHWRQAAGLHVFVFESADFDALSEGETIPKMELEVEPTGE